MNGNDFILALRGQKPTADKVVERLQMKHSCESYKLSLQALKGYVVVVDSSGDEQLKMLCT